MSPEFIDNVRADLEGAVANFKRVFEKVSDERLRWKPSDSARSALELAAHTAFSLGFIREMLEGSPYPVPTMAEADTGFLDMDSTVSSREEALALLNDRAAKYVGFLEKLKPEQLSDMVTMPFGLGEAPMLVAIKAGVWHTQSHTSQLEYLQTIWGDRSW